MKPIQVFKSSGNKYWFDCNCGHQFNIRLADINGIQSSWCSYCANRKLCDNEECKYYAIYNNQNNLTGKYYSYDPLQVS